MPDLPQTIIRTQPDVFSGLQRSLTTTIQTVNALSRVDTLANRPATPALDHIFFTTSDTQQTFVGVNGAWQEVGCCYFVNVMEYITLNGGDVLAGIDAALAVSKLLIFPEGTYDLGDFDADEYLFTVDGDGGVIHIETVGKVKFICNTTDSVITYIFQIQNAISCYIGPMEFEDSGYDPDVDWQGAWGIMLYADDNSGPLSNIRIPSIKGTSMVGVVGCSGTSTVNRISNIKIDLIDADTIHYGLNCQNNGDDLRCSLLKTHKAIRSYFPYGITNHEVNIHSTDNYRDSTGDVDIAAFASGYDTSHIHVRYTSRGSSSSGTLVSLQTVAQTRDVKIFNVDVEVDVDDYDDNGTIADWKDFEDDGLSATLETGATDNQIYNIRLSGRINATTANAFAIAHQPNNIGKVIFEGDFALHRIDDDVRQYLQLTDDFWASTSWTASVSNPTQGNGNMNSRYIVHDGVLDLWMVVNFGTTTTVGSGTYRFGLPFIFRSGLGVGTDIVVGSCAILDAGTTRYVGAVLATDNQAYLELIVDANAAKVSHNNPIAWANGDSISLHARLPCGRDFV